VAREELREGVRYYRRQQVELGDEFREGVRAGIERIREHPQAWHPLGRNTRRHLLHRFPYGLIYQVRDNEILIVAVAHLHREPEY
jgi:plasmid stabilization system protein ParE